MALVMVRTGREGKARSLNKNATYRTLGREEEATLFPMRIAVS